MIGWRTWREGLGRPLRLRSPRSTEWPRWVLGTSRRRQLDPEQVILTPHNLPHSRQGLEANVRMFVRNVLDLAAGRVPAQVVNKGAILTWQQRFAAPLKH
jgi:hypothetical protein